MNKADLGTLVEAFFCKRLISQRRASKRTRTSCLASRYSTTSTERRTCGRLTGAALRVPTSAICHRSNYLSQDACVCQKVIRTLDLRMPTTTTCCLSII